MALPERPSRQELLEELERHEREVLGKLKLRGTKRTFQLDPHRVNLEALVNKLRQKKMETEAQRASRLLEKVKNALTEDWLERG